MFAFVIFLFLPTSSCRIGNYVQPATEPDTPEGYYETQATQLTYFASIDGEVHKATGQTNLLPAIVSRYITSPEIFLLSKDQTYGELHSIYSTKTNPLGIPVSVDKDLKVEHLEDLSEENLTSDPKCDLRTAPFHLLGQAQRVTPYTITFSGYNFSIQGRLALTVEATQEFVGDCGPAMQILEECFKGSLECSENNQKWAQSVFGAYVTSGALSEDSIHLLSKLGYIVEFE